MKRILFSLVIAGLVSNTNATPVFAKGIPVGVVIKLFQTVQFFFQRF